MNKTILPYLLMYIFMFPLTNNASEHEGAQRDPLSLNLGIASATASPLGTPTGSRSQSREDSLSSTKTNSYSAPNSQKGSGATSPRGGSLPSIGSVVPESQLTSLASLPGVDPALFFASEPTREPQTIFDTERLCVTIHNLEATVDTERTVHDSPSQASPTSSTISIPVTPGKKQQETSAPHENANTNSKCCLFRGLWRCLICYCCRKNSTST